MNLPPSVHIQSFNEISFGAFKLPIITVYSSPLDYPNMFVARLYDLDQWTPYVMVRSSLDVIREAIPAQFHRMDRNPDDDPAILEVWI